MLKPSSINSVRSRVMIPVALLEDHVNCLNHPLELNQYAHRTKKVFSETFENIFWCSEELEVDGEIEIYWSIENEHLHMSVPISTALLVVCTKETTAYKVTWSSSLS